MDKTKKYKCPICNHHYLVIARLEGVGYHPVYVLYCESCRVYSPCWSKSGYFGCYINPGKRNVRDLDDRISALVYADYIKKVARKQPCFPCREKKDWLKNCPNCNLNKVIFGNIETATVL